MDQFGVLVEKYGFKPHGNSAPLAQLKSNNPGGNKGNGFPQYIGGGGGGGGGGIPPPPPPPMPEFIVDGLDFIFTPTHTHTHTNNNNTAASTTTTHIPNILDDVNPAASTNNRFPFIIDDPFSTSQPGLQIPINASSSSNAAADDLIPGFAPFQRSDVKDSQPTNSHADDPFLVFEPPVNSSWPGQNSVDDELDRLGRITKIKKEETVKKSNIDDIIGMGTTPTPSIIKPIFQKKEPVIEKSFPGGQKPASSTNVPKDFISLFDDDVNTSGAFEDRDGESDEQRRRRLNSHMRTQDRMAQALAEKKQRDFQTLQEQEERSRLAGTLDNQVKRWASGKEGNLRALLSSLQDVLWRGSGWQTASLGDMMESKSVKKVYYRATLYLHPDKVQQKGLSSEEKYIAEKVFHVLKEAYKVFDEEELK